MQISSQQGGGRLGRHLMSRSYTAWMLPCALLSMGKMALSASHCVSTCMHQSHHLTSQTNSSGAHIELLHIQHRCTLDHTMPPPDMACIGDVSYSACHGTSSMCS